MKPIKTFLAWLVAAVVLALSVAGCRSSGKIPLTESGLPEVTVQAGKAEEVKVIAREFFRDRGYIERDSRHGYEVVFDKPTKSRRSSRALRVRLRLYKQTGNTWRLVGTPMGVQAWRSDLESEVAVPQGASQIQAFLAEIKIRLESAR